MEDMQNPPQDPNVTTDGCKVQLELEFQLKSRTLDAVFGRYLEDACNSMIESFTERARALYG